MKKEIKGQGPYKTYTTALYSTGTKNPFTMMILKKL